MAKGDAVNGTSSSTRAVLYVIPGSHACRSAMLMLEYKSIPYRTVELLTGLHPLLVRLRGFPGHRTPIREVDGHTPRPLALTDRAGTVPALSLDTERIQTNHEIARFLERIQPEPELLPADPEHRMAVEEVERWADEVLQMTARRLLLATAARGLDAMRDRGGKGRLGALLARNELRRAFAGRGARFLFSAPGAYEQQLLDQIPAMLDRVDGWIDTGVLGAPALTVADFMVTPSLALLSYREDLNSQIAARAAGELLQRVLPEPAQAA